MNSTEFCYWLRGWMELTENAALSTKQLKVVQRHLDLVLPCVTPSRKGLDLLSESERDALQEHWEALTEPKQAHRNRWEPAEDNMNTQTCLDGIIDKSVKVC